MSPRTRTRKTEAYKVFEANLERSRAFLRIFDNKRGGGRNRGQPSSDEKELLRGSLVFAVGALDAYLSDLILEIVPAYTPNSQSLKTALKEIAKSDPGLALRVTLCPSDRDRRAEFQTALSDWLESKSFQGAEKVMNALSYLGCALTWPEFDIATQKSAAKELERITEERHDIVHRGRQPYVRRKPAEETIDLIAAMAGLINKKVTELYL